MPENKVKCPKCGNTQFERTTQEIVLVELIREGGGVRDEAMRPYGTEYTYKCTKCGNVLTDEEACE